ncbi:mannosyl-oligosaccharide alpha-1,2-mannosidase IA-like isoform X2 [Bacillus rossius redtenbacheri]|uniref:mannosyl-oligosaccharide alpha-1,2-mannosidase IA-like isoform X2 n=1 Tax=Bacillus rossius redtenbacheri TaxID=93214 RepID=UPI002FDE0F37
MDTVLGLVVTTLLLFSGVRFYLPFDAPGERGDDGVAGPPSVPPRPGWSVPPGAADLGDARDRSADGVTRHRRDVVQKMMKHAWDSYVRYAWGDNELRPISKRGHNGGNLGSQPLGETIVAGLDTLYVMGLMEEFKQGRDWIEENLSFENASSEVSVYQAAVKMVGGLLSCYALTGDPMFRDRAARLTDKLLAAFNTPTGIPLAVVNLKTGWSKNYGWASGACSILSEIGGLHLEFSYLSDVTGNPVYRAKVDHIRRVLKSMDKPNGLYPNYLQPKTGRWGQPASSLGGFGDSFYEYLLKAWLQSGRTDTEARQMYDEAIDNILKHMMRVSPGGLTYISDMKFDRLEHKMGHLACFSGGLLGLGASTQRGDSTDHHMDVAQRVTNTCHEAYDRTATKLAPEVFRFTDAVEAKSLKSNEKYYILRPETFESYFVLWRLTKDPKYREWGWEAVQALEKHCRVSGGYSGLKNVYLEDTPKDDVQQSFFLAETLKRRRPGLPRPVGVQHRGAPAAHQGRQPLLPPGHRLNNGASGKYSGVRVLTLQADSAWMG